MPDRRDYEGAIELYGLAAQLIDTVVL